MSESVLLLGDALEQLKGLEDNSMDSLVTDPPAGISFMAKAWDDDKGGRKQWIEWMTSVMKEAMRVLKPGAHGLVWAIPRTSHWTATALEDAGFEVRDVVTHLFGSGFPKSMDISKAIDKQAGAERGITSKGEAKPLEFSGKFDNRDSSLRERRDNPASDAAKQWQGWGTALKPASEHWILVRKPTTEKTVAANVLKHGTGGINIDASRIEGMASIPFGRQTGLGISANGNGSTHGKMERTEFIPNSQGRFPANLVLDEEAAKLLDFQAPDVGAAAPVKKKVTPITTNTDNYKKHTSVGDDGASFRGDKGGASRFFYVAKASKKDKGETNTHPTVKSTSLMTYLIKLITPPNGIVLDPFMGSGSTGVAATEAGFHFVGIEKEKEYFDIATARINDLKEVA